MCSSCGEDFFGFSNVVLYYMGRRSVTIHSLPILYGFSHHPIMLHKPKPIPTEFLLVRKTDFLYILFYNTIK